MRGFVVFTRLLQCLQKVNSTKVNVNYVKSSIDIFKFHQRVLNDSATRVTVSWLHDQIYQILVALRGTAPLGFIFEDFVYFLQK